MICSTGCSNYDYDRDAPIGITVQEFETNIDAYYYDGSYVMAQSGIEALNNEGIYTDENISIFNLSPAWGRFSLSSSWGQKSSYIS